MGPLPRRTWRRRRLGLALALSAAALCGCARAQDDAPQAEVEAAAEARMAGALASALDRIEARAEAVDEALFPVPLLRSSEEAALRRHGNARHLEQARRLGVPPAADSAGVARLVRAGRLVRLADSTAYWVVRELDHSVPFVLPGVEALLVELAERFQDRLAERGLPPFRLEVTSALRTAALQADLRQTNENAARGTSAHEFGTTVDVAYESFPAPTASVAAGSGEPPRLTPLLRRIEAALLERAAARKSRELQAILGRVLIEMQREGRVLALLEQRQPVYHLTLAGDP